MATTESLFQDPGGAALYSIWRSSVFGVCPLILILSLAADLAEELKRSRGGEGKEP